MSELSVFVDESGDLGTESRWYLVALVLHDQSDSVEEQIRSYHHALDMSNLLPITFHFGPLINGNEDYANLDVDVRKQYLSKFMVLAQHMPFRFQVLAYSKREFESSAKLIERIRRDITVMLFDNLELFQGFDKVKLYYDGGQDALARVLDEALRYVISSGALVEKDDATTGRYVLLQLADFMCGLELEALKFANGADTATDRRFFVSSGYLKRSFLKKFSKKRLG